MHISTAIDLLSNVVYKPGWEFEVKDHSARFENSILITMSSDTFRADQADAHAGGYLFPIRPSASFVVPVGRIHDDCDLYRAHLGMIARYDDHERREFYRVAPSYWAPFHPHTTDGMERWGNPDADIAYGTT